MPTLRRLRLVLGREPDAERTDPAGSPREPGLPPQVEFVAYGEDCVLSGYVRLDADRLTDLLDDHEEFELLDVYAQDLDAATGIQVANVLVKRDELLLIHAGGPRGDRGRRRRTRQYPVAIRIGPYQVRGYIHAIPGSDPLANFRRRRPMVPLTDASIEFTAGDALQGRTVGTLIVNRDLVDWIAAATDAEVEMPEIPMPTSKGPRVKDFTGQIHFE